MNGRHQDEHWALDLIRQILEADDPPHAPKEDVSDKELYSLFAKMIVLSAVLALTVGPFSLIK